MRFKDCVDVFSKDKAETLIPHLPIDRANDFEPDFNFPHGQIYNLLEVKLNTLKAYIKANLANRFIQQSSSPAAVPILLAMKMDGGLKLCVEYQALHRAMVRNQYSLPLVSEMLNRLRGAGIFTKLGLQNASHLIWIKQGNKYITALQTR